MVASLCIPAPLLNDVLPQSGGNAAPPEPFAAWHAEHFVAYTFEPFEMLGALGGLNAINP